MEPILREDGSVLVHLTNGTELCFVPSEPGRFRLVLDDPRGAHYSLGLAGADVRAIREATGMLTLQGLWAVGDAA
jgi:hypothetical protein